MASRSPPQTDQQFNVPVVDFGKFWTGSAADRLTVSREIVKAFREIGFAYISNHNIQQCTIDKAFEEVKHYTVSETQLSLKLYPEFRFLCPSE